MDLAPLPIGLQPPPSATHVFESATGNSMKWALVAFVVSVVICIIMIYAIVLLNRKVSEKASGTLPTVSYSKPSTPTPNDSDTIAGGAVAPVYPVISDSQIIEATMERFLGNIAREKPIRLSPEDLTGYTHNFSTQLGSGAFGVVYKGQFPDGVEVAVKVLKKRSDKSVEQQFMAEVGTIGRTYHMNLVRLYGFCFDKNMKALVYEYMENGSLDSLLFCDNHVVEWGKLQEIAVRTAKGIAYLHEECQQMIIHYDIKPQNVLLDENLNPKVADFGLAKLCNRERSQISRTGFKGTPGYAAPELYMPYPATHKCDVYSFGMLLFEIAGRRRNHDASLSESRVWLPRWSWKMHEKNEIAEMLSFCGIEERDMEKAKRMCLVAMWCVQYLPVGRPSMSTVAKMLEGGMEIPPPPNPFEYLQSYAPNGFASGSDDEDSDPSTSMTKTSQPSSFRIEIIPDHRHTM